MTIIVRNNKGFSLIELMFALFILAFSLLGFLGVMANSIDSNLQNEIRNTAIRLATQTAETLFVQDFNSLDADNCNLAPYNDTNDCIGDNFEMYPNPTVPVRGFQQTYNVTWTIAELNDNLRQIQININYNYRNQNFNHDTVIYRNRN